MLYKVRLIEDKKMLAEQSFEIKKDPRLSAKDEDYKEQFDLVQKVNKKVSECHKTINQIKKIKTSVSNYLTSIKDTAIVSKLKKVSQPMVDSLEIIENALMQTKAKAPQDVLAYPIRLNDKMAGVASYVMSNGFGKPNKQHYAVYEDLAGKINTVLSKFNEIKNKKVPEFNELVKQQQIQAIVLEGK
jgi:accessory colonization factor AcfC